MSSTQVTRLSIVEGTALTTRLWVGKTYFENRIGVQSASMVHDDLAET
jgi:hypothetical protein